MSRQNETDNKRTGDEGFTLVEVLVTLTIIGLLTAGVALAVIPRVGDARSTKALADIASYQNALELYRLDHFRYPDEQDGLEALVSAPPSVNADKYPADGYIQRLRDDPWGNPYVYRNPGASGPYDIISYGADGQEGGDGDDADVISGQ